MFCPNCREPQPESITNRLQTFICRQCRFMWTARCLGFLKTESPRWNSTRNSLPQQESSERNG